MLSLIAYVAAVFYDPRTGEQIFEITLDKRGQILTDVPAAIRKDPLFGWLMKDGSIRVVEQKNLKQLENEPMKDVTAEGKSATAAALSEADAEETAAEEAEEAPAKATRGKKTK